MSAKDRNFDPPPAKKPPPPFIDDRVDFRGISFLRTLNLETARELSKVTVIQDDGERILVVIPYEDYMRIQEEALGKDSV